MLGSGGRASELKQQGALEAARDSNSSVTAYDAERKVVDEAKAAGSVGLIFNPDASPEEKAAQAGARIPSNFHHERKPKAVALASDIVRELGSYRSLSLSYAANNLTRTTAHQASTTCQSPPKLVQ